MARACYVANYAPASYKGVAFEALEADSEHGRRGAEAEFPFGETTQYADTGRRIRRYSISGRFAENTHVADARALIAVVETPGTGILVHPTRGALRVACTSLKVTDKIEDEQGVTYFEAQFVEGNEVASGFLFGTSLGGINLSTILDALSTSFISNYTPNDVRWYQSTQVQATAADAVSQVSGAYQSVTASAVNEKVYQTLSDFNTVMNDPGIIRDPTTLSTVIKNGMSFIDQASTGATKVAVFRTLANWGAKSSTLTGEAATSQNAIFSFVRSAAAAYMVRGILEKTTTTLNAALADYDTIMVILDEEAEVANATCNDPRLYLALRDFIITTGQQLLTRAYTLPALVQYTFIGGMHSLVAAYELFNDAKRFEEIETRNPQYLPWAVGQQIVAANS